MSVTAEDALWTRITNAGAVTAIVDTRVYFDRVPQGTTRPYVFMFRVSAPRDEQFSGASGVAFVNIQIESYAKTKAQTQVLAAAIRAAIEGAHYTVTVDAETVTIQDCILTNDLTEFAYNDDLSDEGLYRMVQEYSVVVNES